MRMSKAKIEKLKGKFEEEAKQPKKQHDILDVVKVLLTEQAKIAKESAKAGKDNVIAMRAIVENQTDKKIIVEQSPMTKKKWKFKHTRQVIDGKSVIVETVATEI